MMIRARGVRGTGAMMRLVRRICVTIDYETIEDLADMDFAVPERSAIYLGPDQLTTW